MTVGHDRWTPDDLTSLDERLGLLLLVRVGLVAAVVLTAGFAPSQLGLTSTDVALPSACYLVIAGAAEWRSRRVDADRLWLHRLLLPFDALYLVWTTVPAGGAVRATVLLLAVHLVAVTLLASLRSGIRLVLWESFLLVVARVPWSAATLAAFDKGHAVTAVAPAVVTATAVVGLWAVALCTGWFSSVNERELRRAKTELGTLAAMTAELEQDLRPSEILDRLLVGLVGAFRLERAVAVWDDATSVEVRAIIAAEGVSPPASLPPRPPGDPGWNDELAVEAWETRASLLVRSLDPEANPVLGRLLPGAHQVVVLPLGPDKDHRGVVAIAIGRAPLGERLPRRTLVAMGQFAAHASLALRNARLMQEQEQLARRDGLTGLANRRHLDEVIEAEISRSARNGEPLSLVVLDIDRFKTINDTHGHQVGDQVIRDVAAVLAAGVRKMDTAARYGGEEFALVLPSCGVEGALRVAESARKAIAAAPSLQGVTVSAGIATLPAHAHDGDTLLRSADAALYRSKREGRNRVTSAAAAAAPVGCRS